MSDGRPFPIGSGRSSWGSSNTGKTGKVTLYVKAGVVIDAALEEQIRTGGPEPGAEPDA